LLAHGFGAMQALYLLQKKKHICPVQKTSIYASVCFLNPFWSVPNFSSIKEYKPYIDLQVQIGGDLSMSQEFPIDPANIPVHQLPWIYDTNNKYQRRLIPLKNIGIWIDKMIEIHDLIEKCEEEALQIGQDFPPCFVYIGSQDKVVCNNIAEKLYVNLFGIRKQINEEEEMDHFPF
jgi:hypothetical protein